MTYSLLTTFQQWALFTAVVAVVGCVAWTVVVAPGAAAALRVSGNADDGTLRVIQRRVAGWGAFIGVVLIAVWILRMVVQVIGFRDPFVPLSEDVSFLLFDTFWGTIWMVQGALLPFVIGAFLLARPPVLGPETAIRGSARVSAGRVLSALLVLGLAATLTLSSHAMGVESRRALIVAADGIHLLAAGTWIGSLVIVLGPGRAGGPGLLAAQLRAFSPMAIASVALLTVMGVVLAWTHLVTVSDLWTTGYGRLLGAKVGAACIVFAAGFWNWRQGLPAMDTDAGVRTVQRRAAFEVSVAVVVLLLTAMLVHSAKPS